MGREGGKKGKEGRAGGEGRGGREGGEGWMRGDRQKGWNVQLRE